MSMLTLNGTIINVFQAPKGVSRKTGEEYGGQDRVQVMAENILQNGEKRVELVDLTVENPKAYTPHQGKRVRVPVGVFCTSNVIRYFVPKGSLPEVIAEGQA
jgi:endonuclease V-like protein UPF0215 family